MLGWVRLPQSRSPFDMFASSHGFPTMNVFGLNATSGIYTPAVGQAKQGGTPYADGRGKPPQGGVELGMEELTQIQKLSARDRQVRQHEQAHLAAAGGLATSAAKFDYQKGPDGVDYAIGGEVGIDLSPGRTPGETMGRAQKIRAAALAPADPSSQDLAIAAKALQMEQQAIAAMSTRGVAAKSPVQTQNDSRKSEVDRYYGGGGQADSSLSVYA